MLGERGQDQGRRPSKQSLLLGVVVGVAVGLVLLNRYADRGGSAASPTGRQFQLLDALVLGVVEGVTEYLPVSSTGHLLLSQHILGLTRTEQAKSAADAYAVMIQIGAILAVLSLYRRRAEQMAWGFLGRDPIGLRLGVMLLIAFLPAAIVGLAFEKAIKQHLFGPWPIVVGWLVGGIVILVLPRRLGNESNSNLHSVENVGWRPALMIGVFQVCAMWPGVSRSLATIVGGLVAGLGLTAAVEFSFLLGLITLGAATTFELLKTALASYPNMESHCPSWESSARSSPPGCLSNGWWRTCSATDSPSSATTVSSLRGRGLAPGARHPVTTRT